MDQANRGRRALHFRGELVLERRGDRRRRDVDRFLEEGSDQRIGLVEDRQHSQGAVAQQPLDGVLLPFEIPFDNQRVQQTAPLRSHIRPCQQRSDPLDCRDQLFGRIRSDHATAP